MPQKAWTGCTNMSLEEAKELCFAFISLLADVEKIKRQAPPSELLNNLQDELIQAHELAKKIQVFADLRDTGFSVAGAPGIISLEQELPQCATYDRDFEGLKTTFASRLTLIRKLGNPIHSLLEVSLTLRDERSMTKRLEKELSETKHKRSNSASSKGNTIVVLEADLRKAGEENQQLRARMRELEGDLDSLHKKVEKLHFGKTNHTSGLQVSPKRMWFQGKDDSQEERIEELESQIQSLKETIQSNNDLITKLNKYKRDDNIREADAAGFEFGQLQGNVQSENPCPSPTKTDEPRIGIDDILRKENSDLKFQAEDAVQAYNQLQETLRRIEKEEKKHVLEIQQLNYYVINLRKEVSKYRQDAGELSTQKIALEKEVRHVKLQFERIAGSMNATVDQWREASLDQMQFNQVTRVSREYETLPGNDGPVELESPSTHVSNSKPRGADAISNVRHAPSTLGHRHIRRDLSVSGD